MTQNMQTTQPLRPFALAAFVVFLTGCGHAASGRTWTVTVDTLPTGAVHVVNTPPAHDPGPTWTLREELRIGSVEAAGPTSFGQLKGIAVAGDGRIAVLDAQAQEIRVFGPSGEHLATYGGKGGGPGELEGAWGLMRSPDDQLWVPDQGNARMSVFDFGAGYVTSYPLRILMWKFIWGGAMGDDGRIFKPSMTLGPPRRNVLRVYGPEMALLDSLPLPDPPDVNPKDPPGAFYWELPGGRGMGYIGVPYYPLGLQVVDPHGMIYSTESGDPSYRIKHWMPGGDTTLVIETRRASVPVTTAERDSVIQSLRADLRQRGLPDQDWSKIPDMKPAVLSMFVTDSNRLWVQTSSADSLRRYDVYEPDGRYAGTVATPLNVYHWVSPVVRGDRIWAIVTDTMDVQYVIRAQMVSTGTEGDS